MDQDNGPEFEVEDDDMPLVWRLFFRENEERKAEKKLGFRGFILAGVGEGEGEGEEE